MSKVLDMVADLEDEIRVVVGKLPYVPADVLGLDRRAGYRLWIDDDAIIVDKHNDRDLQYYGGFEYVDKDTRTECGYYVIYSSNDDRVRDCIEQFEESLETAE